MQFYGETDRNLKFRSGEHIGIASFTFKEIKPSKESTIFDHIQPVFTCSKSAMEISEQCVKSVQR